MTSIDTVFYGQAERRNTVLQRKGGTWSRLAELTGILDVGSARTHGYRDLVLGGPGYCGNGLYRWNGRSYDYACNQADDIDAPQRRACTAAPSGIKWCVPLTTGTCAHETSFDCDAGALSMIEKTICSRTGLVAATTPRPWRRSGRSGSMIDQLFAGANPAPSGPILQFRP